MKIADFSIAKALEGTENTATFNAGTKRWMAPEILLGLEKTKKYSFKVDIWSLGLVLHDLITGGGYLGFTRPPDNWFLIRKDEDIETIEVRIESRKFIQTFFIIVTNCVIQFKNGKHFLFISFS